MIRSEIAARRRSRAGPASAPGLRAADIARRFARFCLLLISVQAAVLAGAVSARAHAALVSTSPADGSVLMTPPARFTLGFSEPVSPIVLTLVGPDGASTALDDFSLKDNGVEIVAPAGLVDGTHVLSWRVVSEDGHPVGGSIVFSIGAPSRPPLDAAEPADRPLRLAILAARTALYLGLFLGVGGAFAIGWLDRGGRAGAAPVAAFLVLGIAAAPPALGLHGVDALGVSPARLADPAVWSAALATTFARTGFIAAAACLLALLSLTRASGTAGRWMAAAALAGVGLGLSASGHAASAEPQWLTRPAVFIHAVSIAWWAGALLPLALAIRRGSPAAVGMLTRFSRSIPPVIALLLAAGAALAIVQVQAPAALVETAYGRVLLGKLLLVAAVLALAAANRWLFTSAAASGDRVAARRLARSIFLEVALVIAILGVASLWRFTPPPRALAIAAAQPASTHIHAEKAMADVSVAPGRAGPVTVTLSLLGGDFGPIDPKEVTLVVSKADAGIQPIRRRAAKADDGTWRVDDLALPVPGAWQVRVDILVSDFEMARLSGEIEIGP